MLLASEFNVKVAKLGIIINQHNKRFGNSRDIAGY